VFAVDVPDAEKANNLMSRLDGHVGCFKVGLELFMAEGLQWLGYVTECYPGRVILDVKLHDIPMTMARAAAQIDFWCPDAKYITIHGKAGIDAIKKMKDMVPDMKLLAVTELTSLSPEDVYTMTPSYFGGAKVDISSVMQAAVCQIAAQAAMAGCDGVICSGLEAMNVRALIGDGVEIMTPGIRMGGSEVGDQKRVVTPGFAIKQGATLLVVGRDIRDAKVPEEAADKIVEEIMEAI
jgi:orotidine-5'-phosphate decarboxylase